MPFRRNVPIQHTARFEFSIGAAAFLLAVLAFVSLLGTFPTEFISAQAPGAAVANALVRLTRFAGGRELYGSPFFLFLLGCLSVFLAEAVIRQLRVLLSKKESAMSQAVCPVPPLAAELPLRSEEARKKVEESLRSSGFKLFRLGKGGEDSLSFHAVKNGFGVWGPVGTHVGLLVVLAAGLITLLFAEVRETEVPEGGDLMLSRERLTLHLEKFSIIPYPGREETRQYQSRFLVKDEKGGRRTETLAVNHPLKLGGTKIFQMRYRVEVPRAELVVYRDGEPFQKVTLEKGVALQIPSTDTFIRYGEVVPNFRIDRGGKVFSLGGAFNNPAIKLFVREGGGEEEARWVFPDILRMHEEKEKKRWDFSVSKFHKVYSSGVRVSNDPGIPWAWAGYILLTFFAFLSSFAVPRFFRVDIRPLGERTEVLLQGISRRDTPGLLEELRRVAQTLSRKGGVKAR